MTGLLDTMPWGQLALACWPLGVAYVVILVVAIAEARARR